MKDHEMQDITIAHLRDAHKRIADIVHRTPVLTSRLLNSLTGAELYFKCENFQRMGAFKMRGASHAIRSLTEAQKRKGVLTHSSGNFAQALALAARLSGARAHIVMPRDAPEVKKAAVRDYGGEIYASGSTPSAREMMAEEVLLATGATFIHPSNDLQVILGNSTAAMELIEDCPDLEIIVAPVGGGGLIAGTALAAHHFAPKVEVIGAEPSGADDAYRSLRDGKICISEDPQTICDALRTNLGDVNFPILRASGVKILRVDDDKAVLALRLLFERMKIVTEPSAAIALAALMSYRPVFAGKKVGLILSGGNIDIATFCKF